MRIRRLKIEVTTERGPFLAEMEFPSGLVIIRADNTSGKSTCLKSMIYALGLERMFGPGGRPPLPPAMMSVIEIEKGKNEVPVLESQVFLELENQKQNVITVQRKAQTGRSEQDWRLITVYDGPLLSEPAGSYAHRQFFVRDPGAAVRENGFHHYLASFFGWRMPEVSRYNGAVTPLYIEAVLPLFFIEQSNGWSAIQSNTPRYFQIRDLEKRAVEFILKLDTFAREESMQRILQEETTIQNEWGRLFDRTRAMATTHSCTVHNLSSGPHATWPEKPEPALECFVEQKWTRVPDAIQALKAKLAQLTSTPIVTVGESAKDIEGKLNSLQSAVDARASLVAELNQRISTDKASIRDIKERLRSLDEDLQKNQDVLKLRQYGASGLSHVEKGVCPSCSQPVTDTLLPQDTTDVPMTIEENIDFIKSQKSLFEKMLAEAEHSINEHERMLGALRKELSTFYEQIRAAKQSLVADNRTPSALQIREQLDTERRITELEQAQSAFESLLLDFASLATRWREIQSRKQSMGNRVLSDMDRRKLNTLRANLVSQLIAYKFHSFPPDKIRIQDENYRPERDGFDLVYDVSASDNIRVIAGYSIALMELAREFATNHPNLLILDEPRQQSLSKVSFQEIFERLAQCGKHGQQAIVATSETLESLSTILTNIPAKVISFEKNILRLVK